MKAFKSPEFAAYIDLNSTPFQEDCSLKEAYNLLFITDLTQCSAKLWSNGQGMYIFSPDASILYYISFSDEPDKQLILPLGLEPGDAVSIESEYNRAAALVSVKRGRTSFLPEWYLVSDDKMKQIEAEGHLCLISETTLLELVFNDETKTVATCTFNTVSTGEKKLLETLGPFNDFHFNLSHIINGTLFFHISTVMFEFKCIPEVWRRTHDAFPEYRFRINESTTVKFPTVFRSGERCPIELSSSSFGDDCKDMLANMVVVFRNKSLSVTVFWKKILSEEERNKIEKKRGKRRERGLEMEIRFDKVAQDLVSLMSLKLINLRYSKFAIKCSVEDIFQIKKKLLNLKTRIDLYSLFGLINSFTRQLPTYDSDFFALRKLYTANIGWSLFNKAAVDEIAALVKDGMLLEIAAGAGAWSAMLRAMGVNVVTTEYSPPPRSDFDFNNLLAFTDIKKMTAIDAVETYPDANVLLCSWPPLEYRIMGPALRAFSNAPGKYFVYIGEERGGCTGDEEMFDELEKSWTLVKEVDLPTFPGIYDQLYVYRSSLALMDCPAMTQDGIYELREVALDKVDWASQSVTSYIGNASTAEILSTLLDIKVPMNRAKFRQGVGQLALVFSLNAHQPEGVVLSKDDIERIGYTFKLLKRKA